MGYRESKPRTFVLKLNCPCENCPKRVKKVVEKIPGVDSVLIDREQGKVRIRGNVDPQTIKDTIYDKLTKRVQLSVEEEQESPPKIKYQEKLIVSQDSQQNPVRIDQRKVAPQLRDNITEPIDEPMAIKVRDCFPEDNHELELKRYNKRFTCNRCREDGFASRYRCKHLHCDYDVHEECMNPEPEITHELFEGYIFKFRQKPPEGSTCNACGIMIHGYSYRCEVDNLNLHPHCSKLPGNLGRDGKNFVLTCESVKERCSWCNEKRHPRHVEKKVPGWCYVSKRDKFSCHVYCLSEIMHEVWRRGDLVHKDDDDNYGTYKALEKVDLKLVANKNGSGGGGGSLFRKTLTLFLKAIIGILFGDPTGLIVFAVTEFVQSL